ncbi:MAG: hypothetical protein V3R66_00805 [Rhodospirillales bacterium]
MEKPKQPRLEDFGLTEDDCKDGPGMLHRRVSAGLNSYACVAIGAGVGLWSLWGFYDLVDSLLKGVFFGVLIAFVVFLLAGFFGSMFLGVVIFCASWAHRLALSMISSKARSRYAYSDAHRKYQSEKLKHELWLHNNRQ